GGDLGLLAESDELRWRCGKRTDRGACRRSRRRGGTDHPIYTWPPSRIAPNELRKFDTACIARESPPAGMSPSYRIGSSGPRIVNGRHYRTLNRSCRTAHTM